MNFYSLINKGYNGELITLQCTVHQGFPSFDITGLTDSVIKESKERIREALRLSGFHFPHEAILINLLPQTLEKSGTTLDVAIALCLLFQKTEMTFNVLALGELDLHGNILNVPGCENSIELAKKINADVVVLPNGSEIDKKCQFPFTLITASNIGEAFDNLLDFVNTHQDAENSSENNTSSINGETFTLNSQTYEEENSENDETTLHPFSGIIGLKAEKEALAIAIAGGHSLLLFGSKGVGKTLLLSRIKYLLPPLDEKTQNENAKIRATFDLYGKNKGEIVEIDSNNKSTVFANTSDKNPEILLANGGVVILDEITNLDEKTLSLLRSIHDVGHLTIKGKERFPLRFSLIGAMNPCPCGNRGSRRSVCNCSENRINAHLKNINTPLLSRFDEVYPIEEASFLEEDDSGFDDIVKRIEKARTRQYKRYESSTKIRVNGDLAIYGCDEKTMKRAFMYFPESENPRDALLHYGIALTLSDLDDNDEIEPLYVEKAKLLKVDNISRYYEK